MPDTRLLLIDDHAMFRSGLAMLLRTGLAGVQVQEAGTLDEALRPGLEAPDVVLLDIVLRGLNGLDGMELLRQRWPQTPIVMVSSDAAPETVRQALARGAVAFVSKEKTADTIIAVVQQVLHQARPGEFAQPKPAGAPTGAAGLTPRQLQVLDLLCQGLPNKTIGRRLDLSENTVRWHVQAILAFLQVSNRSEAAFAARQQRLVA